MSEIQQSTFLLNIFPVIILRWFPVKPQVLLMHTNSAIIYRHVRDHWDTRMLPFFLKYSTCFKDSRSGRRVHTYFSVHSSHHHLLNRHAANCIECTSNSSFFFFPHHLSYWQDLHLHLLYLRSVRLSHFELSRSSQSGHWKTKPNQNSIRQY